MKIETGKENRRGSLAQRSCWSQPARVGPNTMQTMVRGRVSPMNDFRGIRQGLTIIKGQPRRLNTIIGRGMEGTAGQGHGYIWAIFQVPKASRPPPEECSSFSALQLLPLAKMFYEPEGLQGCEGLWEGCLSGFTDAWCAGKTLMLTAKKRKTQGEPACLDGVSRWRVVPVVR